MKKVFLLIATAALFVACTPKAAEEAEQTVDNVTTEVVDSVGAAADSIGATVDSLANEVK